MIIVVSIVFFSLGMISGSLLLHYLNKEDCKHDWKFKHHGKLLDFGECYGFYEAYMCTKCLKPKIVEMK